MEQGQTFEFECKKKRILDLLLGYVMCFITFTEANVNEKKEYHLEMQSSNKFFLAQTTIKYTSNALYDKKMSFIQNVYNIQNISR